MVVINGVNCLELVAGLEESIPAEHGPVADNGYLCDWALRYQLANGMLGLTSSSSVGGGVTFTHPYPYPESSNLWVHSVSIKGVGVPFQGPAQLAFPFAIVTAHFEVPQFGINPDPENSIDPDEPFIYATQEIDYSLDSINIPGSLTQSAFGDDLNSDWNVQLPRANISIQLHRVPYLPAQQILASLQNPLNGTTFLGMAPRHVMFNGAKTHRTTNSDGTYTQDVGYSFSYRPIVGFDETVNPDPKKVPPLFVQVFTKTVPPMPVIGTSDLNLVFPTGYF
jgi:hypothetical protein